MQIFAISLPRCSSLPVAPAFLVGSMVHMRAGKWGKACSYCSTLNVSEVIIILLISPGNHTNELLFHTTIPGHPWIVLNGKQQREQLIVVRPEQNAVAVFLAGESGISFWFQEQNALWGKVQADPSLLPCSTHNPKYGHAHLTPPPHSPP